MASAVRNTTRPTGALPAASVMMPSAKAMSVAIGMPQPSAVGAPRLMAEYKSAGTSMPPSAAQTGSTIADFVRSSP